MSMYGRKTGLLAAKLVLPLFLLLFAQSAARAQAVTPYEQACFDMIQGKVAWNQAGEKKWFPGNIRTLCSGTTNPSATVSCFQAQIVRKDDFGAATRVCAAKPIAAPTPVPAPVLTPVPTPARVLTLLPTPDPPQNVVVNAGNGVGGGPSRTPITPGYIPGGYTQAERECQASVQLHVRWMQTGAAAGTTDSGLIWSAEALNALCKGSGSSADTKKTIDCFNRSMAANKDPQKGIEACAANPPPAGRKIDFIVYDTPDEDALLSPDQLDPIEVELVASPLSDDEMKSVMKWIAAHTSSDVAPYCYKGSYDRGAGVIPGRVADCPPGYTNNGATCGRNADSMSKPSKTPSCPPGHTNTGFYCYQGPDTYSAPSVLANCPSGYTNMGLYCQTSPPFGKTTSTMVCPSGYFLGPAKRCFVNCKAGYTNNGETCGRGGDNLGMDSMTCPSGYTLRRASGRCIAPCPDGYINTGETCYRAPSTLGIGSMLCKNGEERTAARCFPSGNDGCKAGEENRGGLCYTACKSGYSGSATICYQSCPAKQPVECAAGCATSKTECGTTTATMALAPILAVISIATLTPGALEFKEAIQAGTFAAEADFRGDVGLATLAKKLAQKARPGRLRSIVNTLKSVASSVETTAAKFVGGEESLAAILGAVDKLKTANKVRVTVSKGYRLVYTYASEYSDRFSELTSPEIAKEIDSRFGPVGARRVKMEWARYNLSLILKSKDFSTAQTLVGLVSTFDPTGLTGVVSAFLHPVCKEDTPFPAVTAKYNY